MNIRYDQYNAYPMSMLSSDSFAISILYSILKRDDYDVITIDQQVVPVPCLTHRDIHKVIRIVLDQSHILT